MDSRSSLRERLGVYILGIAVGCVIAGFILNARAREAVRREAAAAQRAANPNQTPPE